MGGRLGDVKEKWRSVKTSSRFHSVLVFLIFVAVATIFWFIIALNDSVTETFRVKLHLQNVPDSVTFINDPPTDIHVTLRDKGTNILRSGVVKDPVLNVNFRDYAHDGILRLSHTDLNVELKANLGASTQISSTSIDSLRLYYTTEPGRRVPVVVQSEVSAASGYIIAGKPTSLTKSVMVYSFRDEKDTVHSVRTQRLVKRDLSQTSTFEVKLVSIPNVKIVPSKVKVKIPVEPLVHKVQYVAVDAVNVPAGESLLLFPNRVPVSFYIPMSRFNDEDIPINATVDYADVKATTGARIPVRVSTHVPHLVNVGLDIDSVEYTLVKN